MKTYELNVVIKKHYKKPIYSWGLYDGNMIVSQNCRKLDESMSRDEIVINILKTVASWIINNNNNTKYVELILYVKEGNVSRYNKLLKDSKYSRVKDLIDKIGRFNTGFVYESFFKYENTEKMVDKEIERLNQIKETEYLESLTDKETIKERLIAEQNEMETYMDWLDRGACANSHYFEKMQEHYNKFNILLSKLINI